MNEDLKNSSEIKDVCIKNKEVVLNTAGTISLSCLAAEAIPFFFLLFSPLTGPLNLLLTTYYSVAIPLEIGVSPYAPCVMIINKVTPYITGLPYECLLASTYKTENDAPTDSPIKEEFLGNVANISDSFYTMGTNNYLI